MVEPRTSDGGHPVADPGEVVRAVSAGVSRLVAGRLTSEEREQQLDRLAAMYAEHTDVRHPFAPLGDTPLRTRAELRHHFEAAGDPGDGPAVDAWAPVDETVHRTGDPEVVVYEFRYAGSVGGREFSVPCVFVVRVHDGEIVESRDYADHVGMARGTGQLPALAARLADTA